MTEIFNPTIGAIAPGYIAEPEFCEYQHRFGGGTWSYSGFSGEGVPALLMILDFKDPRLRCCEFEGFNQEIPFFSVINCEGDSSVQEYEIDWQQKCVTFRSITGERFAMSEEDQLEIPFREQSLNLRRVRRDEVPVDESTYWSACDSFIGGNAFLRVGGSPVYLSAPIKVEPSFLYVGAIGYENYTDFSGLVEGEAFFLGEYALYYYFNKEASIMRVISQGS